MNMKKKTRKKKNKKKNNNTFVACELLHSTPPTDLIDFIDR